VPPRQREVLEAGPAGPAHSGTQPPAYGGGVVISFTYIVSKHHSHALSPRSTHMIITITVIGDLISTDDMRQLLGHVQCR